MTSKTCLCSQVEERLWTERGRRGTGREREREEKRERGGDKWRE